MYSNKKTVIFLHHSSLVSLVNVMNSKIAYIDQGKNTVDGKKKRNTRTMDTEKERKRLSLAFYMEINDGTLCEASTTLLTTLHKCDSSTGAVITHFTTLILILRNVNIHIININAENNVVICNYRLALIFFLFFF